MIITVEFGLVENALHSLKEAIDYYQDADEDEYATKYKFSILLAAQCAELLLKEILQINHPALLFENIDKVSDLENDDNQTVNYVTAIKRAKTLCNVRLYQYEEYLSELGKVRNKIQHFKYDINGEYHKKLMARSFSAIEFLLRDVLNLRLEDYPTVIDESYLDFLHEDVMSYKTRLADIKSELKQSGQKLYKLQYQKGKFFDIHCSVCGCKNTLVSNANRIVCKMCGMQFKDYKDIHEHDFGCVTSQNILRELGRRKNKIYPIYECPECENESLIQPENDDWFCVVCGKEYEGSTYCDICGNEMPNDDSFYSIAFSDYDTEDYMCVCPKCANKVEQDEEYMGYEISG